MMCHKSSTTLPLFELHSFITVALDPFHRINATESSSRNNFHMSEHTVPTYQDVFVFLCRQHNRKDP